MASQKKTPAKKKSSPARPPARQREAKDAAAEQTEGRAAEEGTSAGEEAEQLPELPADVSAALVRGVGAYIRQSAQLDLPTRLRRFRGFTDKSLMRHTNELLAVLEDEAQRALIVQWLEQGKPAVSKDVSAALGIAARREDGWQDALQKLSRVADASETAGGAAPDNSLAKAVEREKAKASKARDELRSLREASASELKAVKVANAALEKKIADLEARLAEVTERANDAEKRAARAEEQSDREVRRARKDADDAAQQMGRLKEEARLLRKENEELHAELARAAAKPKKKAPAGKKEPQEPTGPRRPLPVPKGRFEDAPETLEEWLGAPNVHLVVDGYNVTKAEGGYGELALEVQRERLIDEVGKLVLRRKIPATIVFDGSLEVGPRPARGGRSPVKVEYSKAEIADDHIVALLERLPRWPVLLATNDRELQERARAHGATIATSNQLLALFH